MSPAAKVQLRGSQLRARLSTGRSLPVGPARACLASPLPARLGSGPGPRRPLGQALACGCPPPHASLVVAPHLVGQRGVSFRPFYCCGRTDQQPTCALLDSSHVVSFAVGFSGWPPPSVHLCSNLGVAGEESALAVHVFDMKGRVMLFGHLKGILFDFCVLQSQF